MKGYTITFYGLGFPSRAALRGPPYAGRRNEGREVDAARCLWLLKG